MAVGLAADMAQDGAGGVAQLAFRTRVRAELARSGGQRRALSLFPRGARRPSGYIRALRAL